MTTKSYGYGPSSGPVTCLYEHSDNALVTTYTFSGADARELCIANTALFIGVVFNFESLRFYAGATDALVPITVSDIGDLAANLPHGAPEYRVVMHALLVPVSSPETN